MILFPTAHSFTRPADTTQYTAGDLIANSTTAGSVVPLSWVIPGLKAAGGIIRVHHAIIRKSSNVVTAFDLKLELYGIAPTFVTSGDNSAVTTCVATGNADWQGHLDLVGASLVNSARDASGASGMLRPVTNHEPFYARLSSNTLYGILQARNTYTPTSAEVISVRPVIEIVG